MTDAPDPNEPAQGDHWCEACGRLMRAHEETCRFCGHTPKPVREASDGDGN